MPRNNREWAQRKLESSIGNLEKAAGHLLQIAELYENEKVEYVSKNCYILLQALAELPEMTSYVEEEIKKHTFIDCSKNFLEVSKYIDCIHHEIDSLLKNLKEEIPTKKESKIKGVIDAIMIICQGLVDLKKIF
jgi:hypothetical protein